MTLVGNKGLPQGLVLSPFYTISLGRARIGSSHLDVYVAHRLFNVARGLVQTACISLNVFFSSMGLTISASKSEVLLFIRKQERQPILVRIGTYVLPQTTCFKYLGIFFDSGLRWSCHVKYVRRRFLQKVTLSKSVAGVSWEAHPSCLILWCIGDSIGPGIWLGLFYEYGKDKYAGFGKSSVPGIE
jgi:hypothetical protein